MEMNKYQVAYQNVQAELPVDNEDIVVLRELVEKSIPKMVDVTKPGLPYRAAYKFSVSFLKSALYSSMDKMTLPATPATCVYK